MRPILITTTRLKHNKVMYRVVDLAMLQVKTRGQLGTARRRSATLSPRPASDQKASIQYALTPAFILYPIKKNKKSPAQGPSAGLIKWIHFNTIKKGIYIIPQTRTKSKQMNYFSTTIYVFPSITNSRSTCLSSFFFSSFGTTFNACTRC